VLADTGGGRLATEHEKRERVRAKHGKHAPCSVFFVFGRWERAGETGEGVGGYGSGAGYPPNTKNSRQNRLGMA